MVPTQPTTKTSMRYRKCEKLIIMGAFRILQQQEEDVNVFSTSMNLQHRTPHFAFLLFKNYNENRHWIKSLTRYQLFKTYSCPHPINSRHLQTFRLWDSTWFMDQDNFMAVQAIPIIFYFQISNVVDEDITAKDKTHSPKICTVIYIIWISLSQDPTLVNKRWKSQRMIQHNLPTKFFLNYYSN